eukprot:TRINITY_DN8498_c0_g1_i2.p2 TRINITY_DN8498_c0_g1~~TRINITY_DN8498_c0_g1_i2.p2  ORF type:complete len:106 (-),score=18.59 TRINITY_DN8498_c0_g1_i2:118-435(-)
MLDIFFFFSSRRRHTRFLPVSWARRCVQETDENDKQQALTIDQINKYLKKFQFDITIKVFNSECPICWEEFKQADSLIRMNSCQHILHQQCGQQWFRLDLSLIHI